MNVVSLYCDSEATMSRAYNEVYNGKSRHISLRHDYIRELINNGVITIIFVKSVQNLADPLTKPLSRKLVSSTANGMGLKSLFTKHQ